MSIDQLKGRAQIDHLKVLAAIIRKYGINDKIELTLEDMAPVRGGLKRDICTETGTIEYRFERDK